MGWPPTQCGRAPNSARTITAAARKAMEGDARVEDVARCNGAAGFLHPCGQAIARRLSWAHRSSIATLSRRPSSGWGSSTRCTMVKADFAAHARRATSPRPGFTSSSARAPPRSRSQAPCSGPPRAGGDPQLESRCSGNVVEMSYVSLGNQGRSLARSKLVVAINNITCPAPTFRPSTSCKESPGMMVAKTRFGRRVHSILNFFSAQIVSAHARSKNDGARAAANGFGSIDHRGKLAGPDNPTDFMGFAGPSTLAVQFDKSGVGGSHVLTK